MYVVAHNGAHIWGGAERATALLLAGLTERGHHVLLLCNDARVATRAAEIGVPTRLLPLGGDIALTDAASLAGFLRRERPDVLLIATFKKMWLAALAGRLAGVRRIVVRVGLESDRPRSWKYRFVLRRWVSAVVVNAARMRGSFLALPGWDASCVVTIHNGVRTPPRRGAPGAVRSALGIPADAPVVGAVGRLARQKRYDRLLRALTLLAPETHCILAGDGPLRDELASLAAELGLQGRVHFLGQREDTGDVLDALDVFVLCSDQEGMSNAMLEALAAGVPVVSTPVSGADEALDPLPDRTLPGRVVPFEVEPLATALGELLGAPDLRARMAAAARARADERFSFDAMLDRWERVLSPPVREVKP